MKAMARGSRYGLLLALALCGGCASDGDAGQSQEPRYTIIREPEPEPETSGLPPDKQADIFLVLQQREPTARKCYQDVLNERQDRGFEGRVAVVIQFDTKGRASAVRIEKSTLDSREVESCLIDAIKKFEFPELQQPGEMKYEYTFRPAY